MATQSTIVVNPTFRLDVDGRLFKETSTNEDVQDTLIFNRLYTMLSIVKGDLPLFPDIGLKQHLFNFGFVDEEEIESNVEDFEDDMETQLGRDCAINYTLDKSDKSVDIDIGVSGLQYPISFKYMNLQNSIRIIHYEFNNQ